MTEGGMPRGVYVLACLGDGKSSYEQCGTNVLEKLICNNQLRPFVTLESLVSHMRNLWYVMDQCHGMNKSEKGAKAIVRIANLAAMPYFCGGLFVLATKAASMSSTLVREREILEKMLLEVFEESQAYLLEILQILNYQLPLEFVDTPPPFINLNLNAMSKMSANGTVAAFYLFFIALRELLTLLNIGFGVNPQIQQEMFKWFGMQRATAELTKADTLLPYVQLICRPVIKRPFYEELDRFIRMVSPKYRNELNSVGFLLDQSMLHEIAQELSKNNKATDLEIQATEEVTKTRNLVGTALVLSYGLLNLSLAIYIVAKSGFGYIYLTACFLIAGLLLLLYCLDNIVFHKAIFRHLITTFTLASYCIQVVVLLVFKPKSIGISGIEAYLYIVPVGIIHISIAVAVMASQYSGFLRYFRPITYSGRLPGLSSLSFGTNRIIYV